MSDTFLAAALERSFDLQNSSINNNIFSNFKLHLSSPTTKDSSTSTIKAFDNSVLPPPPPSPVEYVNNNKLPIVKINKINRLSESFSNEDLDNKDLDNKDLEIDNRRCIIL